MSETKYTPRGVTRRQFIARAGCTAASLSAASLGLRSAVSEVKRPNVIFVITDDQSRDQFNFLPEGQRAGKGINLTPNIDRLSSEGVIFINQHVSTPVCTPSRFTCLTGQYASRAKNERFLAKTTKDGQTVVEWNTGIEPSTETLPRILQSAGYATGAVGKNHVITAPRGRRFPPDSNANDPAALKQLRDDYDEIIAAYKQCGFDYAASVYNQNIIADRPRALLYHNLDWIVKGALDFIDENPEKPFFLYFATTVPHGPHRDTAWQGNPLATPLGLLKEPLDVLPPRDSIPKRLKAAGIDESKGDMLWLDDAVGALLSKLEQHGVLDNTVIFYFNDHGVESGKGTVYQGGAHTESFVWSKQPWFRGDRTVDALVSNIDFAPTILDVCGVPARPELHDGKSMRPLLEGTAEAIHESLYFEMGYTRAVRKGDWKYIALRVPEEMKNMSYEERKRRLDSWIERRKKLGQQYFEADPMDPFGHLGEVPGGSDIDRRAMAGHPKHYFDEDQLYCLKDDPNEQNNLAGDPKYKAKLDEMKEELTKHLMRVPGTFAEFKR
jgi:arylsulfatase A-like enzyme